LATVQIRKVGSLARQPTQQTSLVTFYSAL
jgi:hypothetical protein